MGAGCPTLSSLIVFPFISYKNDVIFALIISALERSTFQVRDATCDPSLGLTINRVGLGKDAG
ncbi:hypothetical protein GCM10007879_28080 [Maritalea porphyrae]|uniref:Uncharacterized protein n=1 Tax=Maritalea porphyrae TaxID=880732 RepID=A0ABQ5UTF2_9HYPH|nr:hypothetical protein GCM10007879_28080 [Maritalea porphyrae]